jgi:PadR family transcriptional regulator, regulatory protein PadR
MSDNDDRADLLAGTLDLLILTALSAEPLHGLGVSRRIAQVTRGAFDVKAGSLFPALQKLEQEGWLSSEWGRSETNRRAKYYSLTKSGRRQLAGKTRRWNRIAAAIRMALQAS